MTNQRLQILLDIRSLNSTEARRLFFYNDNEFLDFISLGTSSKYTQLEVKKDDDGKIRQLIIDKMSSKNFEYNSIYGFFYLEQDMKNLSKGLDIKLDDLMNLFFLSTLASSDKKVILVTERKKLVNRKWWGRSFPDISKHSVLSPKEANIYIDLFLKKQNKFMAAPNYFFNELLWYLYSMKNKTQNFHLPWSVVVYSKNSEISNKKEFTLMLAALSDRLVDMLVAIDEIGNQYYLGVNNNTQSKTIYHFNYWLTLYIGVLDNLALITQLRYKIEFQNAKKIGLSNNNKDFLKKVFQNNPNICKFLEKSINILSLTHDTRNTVIHRERLESVVVDSRNENFYLNMLKISKKFFNNIVALSKHNGTKLNKWGHYRSHEHYFLEPYGFVKESTSVLMRFVDEYLELLNFKEYLELYPELRRRIMSEEKNKHHLEYKKSLSSFNKGNLGY